MENKVFKTAVVGGFNKEDVLKFVEELTNEKDSIIDELEQKLKVETSAKIAFLEEKQKLEQEKTQLEETSEESDKEKEELLETLNGAVIKLKEKQAHIAKMQQLVKKQNDDIQGFEEKQSYLIDECEQKMQSIRSEYSELQIRFDGLQEKNEREVQEFKSEIERLNLQIQQKDKGIVECSKKFDSTKEELEKNKKILQDHKDTLEQIKDSAANAAHMIENAEKKAEAIVAQAKKQAEEMLETVSTKTRIKIETTEAECDILKAETDEYCKKARNQIAQVESVATQKQAETEILCTNMIEEAKIKSQDIMKDSQEFLEKVNIKYKRLVEYVHSVQTSMKKLFIISQETMVNLGNKLPPEITVDSCLSFSLEKSNIDEKEEIKVDE